MNSLLLLIPVLNIVKKILRLPDVRVPTAEEIAEWERVNPTLTLPWFGILITGKYDPEHSCGQVVEWIDYWRQGGRLIPHFNGQAITMTKTTNVSYEGSHVKWIHGANDQPEAGRLYGGRLADWDPIYADLKEKPILNKFSKIEWDQESRSFVATIQSTVTSGVASTMLYSGAHKLDSTSLSQFFEKVVGCHGGHVVSRYIDDDCFAQTLNMLIQNRRTNVIIDVGAKYLQTPKLLMQAGWRGTYIPVRLPGTDCDYDSLYRLQNEAKYMAKRGAWRRLARIDCREIRHMRVQDCDWTEFAGQEDRVVMLMNSCHYYLGGYTLPFNTHVCGFRFPELEAYYSLFNREGWFTVTTRGGRKWIDMQVKRNPTAYSHPLIRVNASPVTVTAYDICSPYQYCHWYIPAGVSPFHEVKGDNDYRPVNYSTHLCLAGLAKINVPLSNEMMSMMDDAKVVPLGTRPHEWNFATFQWKRQETLCETFRPAHFLLHIPYVLWTMTTAFLCYLHPTFIAFLLCALGDIILNSIILKKKMLVKRWVRKSSWIRLPIWLRADIASLRFTLAVWMLLTLVHATECYWLLLVIPLVIMLHLWRTRDMAWDLVSNPPAWWTAVISPDDETNVALRR